MNQEINGSNHPDLAEPDYLKLARQLAEANKKMVNIPNIHRITDIYSGESFVLGYLDDSENPVNPKEICKVMHVSSARVAMILNQLEQKGLIERKQDAENGRQTLIYLLPAGRAQRQINIERYNERAIPFLRALGPKDAVEYVRLQNRISEIYEK